MKHLHKKTWGYCVHYSEEKSSVLRAYFCNLREKNMISSVSVAIGLRSARPVFDSRQGQEGIFFFSAAFRPALGPTKPPIQGYQGMTLTIHLHIPPRLGICGAIPPLPLRLHSMVLR